MAHETDPARWIAGEPAAPIRGREHNGGEDSVLGGQKNICCQFSTVNESVDFGEFSLLPCEISEFGRARHHNGILKRIAASEWLPSRPFLDFNGHPHRLEHHAHAGAPFPSTSGGAFMAGCELDIRSVEALAVSRSRITVRLANHRWQPPQRYPGLNARSAYRRDSSFAHELGTLPQVLGVYQSRPICWSRRGQVCPAVPTCGSCIKSRAMFSPGFQVSIGNYFPRVCNGRKQTFPAALPECLL